MTVDEIRGRWVGTIDGTNTGHLQMEVVPAKEGFVVDVTLAENGGSPSALVGTGVVTNGRLEMTLSARDPEQGAQYGNVTVTAEPTPNGSLQGTWSTSVGTAGSFTAAKALPSPVQTQTSSLPAVTFSAHEKDSRIRSCTIDRETLRRLRSALRTAAEEAARAHKSALATTQQLPLPQLDALYRVSVLARGRHGDLVLSDDPEVLSSDSLPKPLQRVEFEIGLYYRVANNQPAPNRASLVLDFTRPSAFDFSNPSGDPTPNASRITVYGAEPIWVAGVFERLRAILDEGKVNTGWLHGAHTYDVLLFLLGFPLSLTGGVLLASRVHAPTGVDPRAFGIAAFALAAIVGFAIFRLAFSVIRWLLPYVEFASLPEPVHRRLRVVGATILVGGLTSLLVAAITTLFR
jgi:hypothetical protein